MTPRTLAVFLSCFAVFPVAAAFAATLVPGSANPNLAGRSIGYTCCSGDAVPTQSPPLVTDVEIEECDELGFSVTGKVSFSPGAPVGNNPDGDSNFSMTNFGDGISAPLEVRVNALYGVFLTDESPTGTTTPARLDFNSDFNFLSLSPEIGQIFFIGDGLDSDSNAGVFNGAEQGFIAPRGATRLFLGTADGAGWYNNSGSFTVETVITRFDLPACGDAVEPQGITAPDSLHVLRAAVGTALCAECVCDVDRSGVIVTSDALAVLRKAVGQQINFNCECCPQLE